ncbi:MAG: class I SAM-dependent methyltransferase [Candidatus Korarchaeota archaeon]|nr:class I SAM-dependent methyltransferase [Candidatus Korarchaeota archaeon]
MFVLHDLIRTLLLALAALILCLFIGVQVVGRIIRLFVKFPAPSFLVRFIDNPIRRRVQPPEVVVSWMDVREGMRVLEVGPGSGTFTLEAARRVGGGGAVFAVDIQASVLSTLNARLKRESL